LSWVSRELVCLTHHHNIVCQYARIPVHSATSCGASRCGRGRRQIPCAKREFEPQVVKQVPKFTVTSLDGGSYEVEAETYQDGGHEGRWIDFGGRSGNVWFPVLRVRSADVRKIERKD
jgi:hypothetical protein